MRPVVRALTHLHGNLFVNIFLFFFCSQATQLVLSWYSFEVFCICLLVLWLAVRAVERELSRDSVLCRSSCRSEYAEGTTSQPAPTHSSLFKTCTLTVHLAPNHLVTFQSIGVCRRIITVPCCDSYIIYFQVLV